MAVQFDFLAARKKRLGKDSLRSPGVSQIVSDRVSSPRGVRVEILSNPTPGEYIETRWISGNPQYSRVSRHAGCKAKFAQKGRTDPAARFQNLEISAATEIDCHKTRRSTSPTLEQIRETEEEDVRQLLDAWEQRTGKTAPSRRR